MTTSGYADLAKVRLRLNLSITQTSPDEKIQEYMSEADNYVNTQIGLFADTPITNPDDELRSLASALAAATYNYWVSPEKSEKGVSVYRERIQGHIVAKYGKKTETGLSTNSFTKTSSAINGTE